MGACRRHPGAPVPHSSIRGGSWRTRLLAAPRCVAIARPRPAGLGDRCCGAGSANCLARVLSEGHEPESGRALASPAYRAVSRIARPQPAPSLRPVDGARNQPDRVPGGILGTRARLGLAPWARRRHPGGSQHRHAGQMVPTLRIGALRGRRAALGAGKSAARRLRAPGRRRARPGITRVANAVRGWLVGRRAHARRCISQRPRSRSASCKRSPGGSAGDRPSAPVGQRRDGPGNPWRPVGCRPDRWVVAAARDLRTLKHAQHHPRSARRVPDIHVRRYSGRRPFRLRSRLVRLHLLPGSSRRLQKHDRRDARDALGCRLS